MSDEKYVIAPLSVINEELTVLSQRPYGEVADIITRVQSSVQVLDQKPEMEEVTDAE